MTWRLVDFVMLCISIIFPTRIEIIHGRDSLYNKGKGPLWSWSYDSWIYNYLCNQCLLPLMLWVRISIRVGCTTLCDKVCQWLATGRWFFPGPPVSSTNKTDHHDIAEILLKVVLNIIKQEKKNFCCLSDYDCLKKIFFSY
jgi:hypothetical protein